MSTPTAGSPARRTSANSAHTESFGLVRRASHHQRVVRGPDIDEYADEVAQLLKSRLRLAVNTTENGIRLPAPEDLVKRELDEGDSIDDSHEYAITDTALVDTIGPSWTTRKVREELGGRSNQAVHQRAGRGTLLALPTSDGSTVFPTFQFIRRNGKLEAKAGLQAMFKILKDLDPWHVAVLLNTPAPELDEHSPVAWERQGGDIEDLKRLAHDLVREWSRR